MKDLPGSTLRSLLMLTVLAFTVGPSVHAQSAAASASAAPSRKPVCMAGLKDYVQLDSIPAPYDTVQTGGGQGGFTNEDPEQHLRRDLEEAAAAGATGYVRSNRSIPMANGRTMNMLQLLTIYSAKDTARAYAACRKQPAPHHL